MRLLTAFVLAICTAGAPTPILAQGTFLKKTAPKPAPTSKPVAKPAPAPAAPVAKPTSPPKPTPAAASNATPPRQAAPRSTTKPPRAATSVRKQARVAEARLPPVLQSADYVLFQKAALCQIDPRSILSRMRPTASNDKASAYELKSAGILINGWAVEAAFYTNRTYGGGIVTHDLTVLVTGPVSQILAFARAQPNMALGEVTQGDLRAGTATKYFFEASHLPTTLPFTDYHTVQMQSWELLARAREINAVVADASNTAVITCAQLEISPAALGLKPSKLGPVQRATNRSPVDPTILRGEYRIAKSAKDGCKRLYSQADTYAALDAAMQQEDWAGVVNQLVTMQCKSDLTYFLLGRSAEAMGQTNAAVLYYDEAAKLKGGTLSFSTQCAISRGLQSCHGIEVANEAQVALVRLKLDPPALGPYPLRHPS